MMMGPAATVSVMEIAQAFATATERGHRPSKQFYSKCDGEEKRGFWLPPPQQYYGDHSYFPNGKHGE